MNRELYQKEIAEFADDISFLAEKTLVISGATGMIGSYLLDVLMAHCPTCRVIALGRSKAKAQARFGNYFDNPAFSFSETDIAKPISFDEKVDFIIHAASNTHPVAYATDPIGTITANVAGLQNLLEYAAEHGVKRTLFLSSVEVYGENRGDVEAFDESYCGYIDCNTLRAGYPESKRLGEALCQAYIKQKGLDIVIPRLSRVFGPTLLPSDTKALSQFLHKAIAGENIVLKSAGTQYYSYLYVSDVVSGVLACLKAGKCGEAYNLASENCNITLKDLAQMIADATGTRVVFELPDDVEKAGYSTATKAIMNSDKAAALGWRAKTDLKTAIEKTIRGMKE